MGIPISVWGLIPNGDIPIPVWYLFQFGERHIRHVVWGFLRRISTTSLIEVSQILCRNQCVHMRHLDRTSERFNRCVRRLLYQRSHSKVMGVPPSQQISNPYGIVQNSTRCKHVLHHSCRIESPLKLTKEPIDRQQEHLQDALLKHPASQQHSSNTATYYKKLTVVLSTKLPNTHSLTKKSYGKWRKQAHNLSLHRSLEPQENIQHQRILVVYAKRTRNHIIGVFVCVIHDSTIRQQK